MADPNSIDDLTRVGVGAGGGGLVVALSTLVGRFMTANKLETMAEHIAELNSKLSILLAASERRDSEWSRLDAERRFASLEAKIEALERARDAK